MTTYSLAEFIADCRDQAQPGASAADCVDAIVPLMRKLLVGGLDFLAPEHRRADMDQYTRNAIHLSDDGTFSLFALVWQPGQWTPVHDHGTWGVVGIVDGMLEERAYIQVEQDENRNQPIHLERGGAVLLPPGAVTSFVPNPDHIHLTGNAAEETCVSLHLYGRVLSNFYVYDVEAGTRKLIQAAHYDN